MKIEASAREIITAKDIQSAYLQFYPCMMQYLWDMKAVTTLANLEIAIYKAFPDKDEMLRYIDSLGVEIRDTYKNEEDPNAAELQKTYEHLKYYIDEYEDIGYDIYTVASALDLDSIKKDSENDESDEPIEKKHIQVGRLGTK